MSLLSEQRFSRECVTCLRNNGASDKISRIGDDLDLFLCKEEGQ
jgi:hypothetical protein